MFELLNMGILMSQMEESSHIPAWTIHLNFAILIIFQAWSIRCLLLSCHDWVMHVYLKSWLVTLIAAIDNSLCKHIQKTGEFPCQTSSVLQWSQENHSSLFKKWPCHEYFYWIYYQEKSISVKLISKGDFFFISSMVSMTKLQKCMRKYVWKTKDCYWALNRK